jgi:hypothetical protein
MSATQQTLAQMVRSKYPGAYDDMDDVSLEKSVLAKHPEYSDLPTTKSAAPDLKTGQGMEQQAVEQSRQQIGAPVIQAANEHEARQARLAYLQNRAMNSPTPFSNAVAVLAPVTAARQIAGAKVGSYAGEKIAPMLSDSPDAAEYGSLIGGVLGGTAASYSPGGPTKAVQRITRGPQGTAKVSLNPLEIVGRELEEVVPKQADIQEQMTAAETARQKWLTDRAKLEMQDATEQAAAIKRQQTADRLAVAKKRFADSQAAAKTQETSTTVIPEPRAPLPTDRPGAMWSIGREELPAAAQRGAPGAGDVLRNLNKPIIYTPKEGVGYPGPRQGAPLSDLAGEIKPYTGPEKRISSAYEREIFQKMLDNPEGQELGQSMTQAREGSVGATSEGPARQLIMQNKGDYAKFRAAELSGDTQTMREMLVKAKKALAARTVTQ